MSQIVGDIAVTIGADITPLQTNMKKGSAEIVNFGEKAEQMGRRVKAASSGANRFGGVMGRLSNVSRQTRSQIQNASYQLQDMAVQFQMGTKASTVFAQQLPQLAGGFGPVGAAIGALAGIGIPALAFAFGDVFKSAESMEDALKNLKTAVDEYAAAGELATLTTDELKERFGAASEGLASTLDLLEQINRNQAQRSIDGIGASLAEMLGTGGDGDSRSALADFFDVNIMLAFTDAQRESRAEARALTAEFQNHQRALSGSKGNLVAQIRAMQGLVSSAQSLAAATNGVSAAEEEIIEQLAETLALMQKQRLKIQQVEDATHSWSDAYDIAYKAVASQGPVLDNLLGKVNALASAAKEYAQALGASAVKGGRGGDPRQFDGRIEFQKQLEAQARWTPPTPARSSRKAAGRSGRGGPSRDFAEEMAQLKAEFATEAETIQSEYEKQMALLEEFRSNKVAKEEEFNQLEQRIRKEHAEKLAAIDKAAVDAKLSAVSGALGDVASLMQSGNKKAFAIGKAGAVAEATVSGYKSAVTAWEKGMTVGGPPVAAAFTAASLAKTGSLISKIASTSASGGSFGSTSSPSAASGTSQAPGATYYFDLQGESFGRETVMSTLSTALQGEIDRGGQVIFGGA